MSNYLISLTGNGEIGKGTIHDPGTKLKVKAFDLIKSTFKPRKGEIRYFVTAGERKFAFETEGYQKKHRHLLVLQMIARYCIYFGLIEAQIHAQLPF
jgi:putative NADPH-quinone reductase